MYKESNLTLLARGQLLHILLIILPIDDTLYGSLSATPTSSTSFVEKDRVEEARFDLQYPLLLRFSRLEYGSNLYFDFANISANFSDKHRNRSAAHCPPQIGRASCRERVSSPV